MDKILILDFGSQVTQLIARRVREAGVYAEIHPFSMDMDAIKAYGAKGVILSGGPASVGAAQSPKIDAEILAIGLPVLGICYGQQIMASLCGAQVSASDTREFGRANVVVQAQSPLVADVWQVGESYTVWMSHGDKVEGLPEGFTVLASTAHAPYAAIANEERQLYGVQFHPEVVHTPDGAALLSNFTHKICGCQSNWDMGSFLETHIPQIQEKVGNDQVICAVSGGVDSSVVATLLHQAIGKQLHPIFVNTGMLRKGEAQQVQQMFEDHAINLHYVDASELFLGKLAGVTDPEQKRKIIGSTFIDVFEDHAKTIDNAKYLAQGTLYPDVIESVSVHGDASVTIKSHHNVGGLPERMDMRLIEPVRELFKDEVRALGIELGLKPEMVARHPFPGPGLAIRIPGEITPEKIAILQEADAIYIQAIKDAGLYDVIWQAFAVLLPVKTVGVMGDARTYEYVCALRAVTSTDGMTADYYPFEHGFLSDVVNAIINQVKGINRVVYDVTSKPPGTIEWE